MKKRIFAIALCSCLLLSGCSGVSQEEYDSLAEEYDLLVSEKSKIESEKLRVDNSYKTISTKYEQLKKEHNKLSSDYETLKSETEDWVTYNDAQRQAKLKEAAATVLDAEAEKNEAEARWKASKEQLSQAEAEEQRRLDEGVFIYEDEYVKINYKSIGHPLYSYDCQVNFWVENKTDGVLTFQAECISLDGLDMGYIAMSDPITPQSKGIISARTSSSISDSPKAISGQLRVIDFDKQIFSGNLLGKQSYDVTFINVVV